MTADFLTKVLAAATLLAVTTPVLCTAQDLRCDRGDVEVRGLDFVGNKTFSDAELADVIVTTPSAWGRRALNLPFSTRRCLDRVEYAKDRLRLMVFYRLHGFPDVSVDTALLPSGRGGVRVRFAIAEGPPILLQSLAILGLDAVRRPDAILRGLPIRAGERFDRTELDAARDTIGRRLHNRGYPGAAVTNFYVIHSAPSGQVAEDSLVVQPGPFTRFGAVRVEVTPASGHGQQIDDRVVRQLAGVDSGGIYREHVIADAQRALYQTDAYLRVAIALDSAHGTRVGGDSVVPVVIALMENPMHTARLSTGYGTLDCFRASGELDDNNFLGGAKRLTVQGRLSKIGIGRPLNGAPQLCSQAQHDLYSTQLNYYLGATLQQPFLFGLHAAPTLTAYTSRVSEYNAYVRTTAIGGVASGVWQRSRRTTLTFAYSMDFGRTEAQPALFCAVFNLCASEDRDKVQKNQRLAVASTVVAYDGGDNPVSPTRGGTARLELRHSSPYILSDPDLKFSTLLGDLARYLPLGGGNVLALHLRAGSVFGRGFVPPQERLYAGGPTSVRGFSQNELGAVTYIAASYVADTIHGPNPGADTIFWHVKQGDSTYRRAVPVGGNELLVGNVELRFRSPVLPDVLQPALFVDAGDVWNSGDPSEALRTIKFFVTPGVQLSALTPIGPVRVAVGYNPYQRPSGSIYYENSSALNGALPCVSPGNTLPVTPDTTTGAAPGALVQAPGACPATFAPAHRTSLRSRLTFNLAIGQAF